MDPAALHPINTPPPSSASKRFRVILLVMGLLLFVTYLVVFVPGLSQGSEDQIKAKAALLEAQQLANVLLYYQREYRKFPLPPGTSVLADCTTSTGAADSLMAVLTALPGHPQLKALNPRGVRFYAGRPAQDDSSPGLWATSMAVHLNDPWGRPYRVIFDANGDSHVSIPEAGGATRLEVGTLAIMSLGPDGELGNDPKEPADIVVIR